jgi:hypothetical protein
MGRVARCRDAGCHEARQHQYGKSGNRSSAYYLQIDAVVETADVTRLSVQIAKAYGAGVRNGRHVELVRALGPTS